ncbi:MAG TPA: sugar phosphate isomerase/epimerase family protein [Bryobacteraceae bacterium]|nr:sugar phosphate isomerase/epimerase family protein [Bryobacteraceae bacterium]
MTRRTVFQMAGAAAALPAATAQTAPLKGRLKQSAARWCYGKMSLDDLAREAARIGLKGIDLIDSKEWPVVQKYGLVPAMTPGAGNISDAFNRKENHDRLVRELEENIPRAAAANVPNVITFSGNRRGQADAEGLDNCVIGLNRVKKLAEDKGVTICVELLNSKIDHHDYQCDHTAWGVELIKRVDSPRVKLLYDIYHMQIMEGDIIRTIRQNIQYIAHFHTGGVPGRHELDETQELQWRSVADAIVKAGYTGYFAHEFVPTRDPMKSLEEAARLCDV